MNIYHRQSEAIRFFAGRLLFWIMRGKWYESAAVSDKL